MTMKADMRKESYMVVHDVCDDAQCMTFKMPLYVLQHYPTDYIYKYSIETACPHAHKMCIAKVLTEICC